MRYLKDVVRKWNDLGTIQKGIAVIFSPLALVFGGAFFLLIGLQRAFNLILDVYEKLFFSTRHS